MESGVGEWKCRNCGRAGEPVVGAEDAVRCESCADEASRPSASGQPVGDPQMRRVVARLRERYAEARELVSATEPHSNLEWILGAQRNLDRDDSVLDTAVAEAVVLWMEDLASELDNSPVGAGDHAAIERSRSREATAKGLRSATREFALAFQERTE